MTRDNIIFYGTILMICMTTIASTYTAACIAKMRSEYAVQNEWATEVLQKIQPITKARK